MYRKKTPKGTPSLPETWRSLRVHSKRWLLPCDLLHRAWHRSPDKPAASGWQKPALVANSTWTSPKQASDSSRERTWSNRGKEFLKCTWSEIMWLKHSSLSHLVASTLTARPGLPQIALGALWACPSKEHSWELSQKTMPQKHQPKRLYSAMCKSYAQTQCRQWILTLLLLLTEGQKGDLHPAQKIDWEDQKTRSCVPTLSCSDIDQTWDTSNGQL